MTVTTAVPPSGRAVNVCVGSRAAARRGGAALRACRAALDAGGDLGADQRASGVPNGSPRCTATRAANASFIWTTRSVGVRDDDQVDERVEGVLEQPALPEDVVEQLHVLDRRPTAAGRRSWANSRTSPGAQLASAPASSRTSVPSARRQPRSGATMSAAVAAPELRSRAVDGQAQRGGPRVVGGNA